MSGPDGESGYFGLILAYRSLDLIRTWFRSGLSFGHEFHDPGMKFFAIDLAQSVSHHRERFDVCERIDPAEFVQSLESSFLLQMRFPFGTIPAAIENRHRSFRCPVKPFQYKVRCVPLTTVCRFRLIRADSAHGIR